MPDCGGCARPKRGRAYAFGPRRARKLLEAVGERCRRFRRTAVNRRGPPLQALAVRTPHKAIQIDHIAFTVGLTPPIREQAPISSVRDRFRAETVIVSGDICGRLVMGLSWLAALH